MEQRTWEQATVGELLEPIAFPLSIYRLVTAAGANRDFNSIHHNRDYARSTGAPDMYANTFFLQGMWERLVRAYIGPCGRIEKIAAFRMKRFNCAGETVIVHGAVRRKWSEGGRGLVEIEVWSENGGEITVGPGRVVAALPVAAVAP